MNLVFAAFCGLFLAAYPDPVARGCSILVLLAVVVAYFRTCPP